MLPFPTLLIRFDINKAGGGAYGFACYSALFNAASLDLFDGCSFFDGDSKATLYSDCEYVNCIAVQYPSRERLDEIKAILEKNSEFCALLSTSPLAIYNGVVDEPLVSEGQVQNGVLVGKGWGTAAWKGAKEKLQKTQEPKIPATITDNSIAFCSNCGAKTLKDAMFCSNCGKELFPVQKERESVNQEPVATAYRFSKPQTPPNYQQQPAITQTPKKESKHITMWIVSCVVLLAGVSILFNLTLLGGIFLLILGAYLLPPIQKIIKQKLPKFDKNYIKAIVIVVLFVLYIICAIYAQNEPNKTKNSSANKPSATPIATKTPAPTVTHAPTKNLEPKEGEFLYAGNTSYLDIKNLEFCFILSSDKSFIYDIKINIEGLYGIAQNGNAQTTITLDSMVESFGGEYNVDFFGTTNDIKIGDSTILSLSFKADGTAELDIDYTYTHTNTSGGKVQIPFGENYILLQAKDWIFDEETPATVGEEPENVEPTPTPSPTLVVNAPNVKIYSQKSFKNEFSKEPEKFSPDNPQKNTIMLVRKTDSKMAIDRDAIRDESELSSNVLSEQSDKIMIAILTINPDAIFTDNPNEASVLLAYKITYPFAGNYGPTGSLKVYNCAVDFSAYNLKNGESIDSVTYKNIAGTTVSSRTGSSALWLKMPDFISKDGFEDFALSLTK